MNDKRATNHPSNNQQMVPDGPENQSGQVQHTRYPSGPHPDAAPNSGNTPFL
ncbi:MAG: hypothetical protein NTV01_16780 [Bacteroidia bacterium]|nr:hypothetical protein [Bacteroidia bacterium]